ncbi:hypothetical protein RB213_014689, partial [Colletotrichum asianum]
PVTVMALIRPSDHQLPAGNHMRPQSPPPALIPQQTNPPTNNTNPCPL